MLKNIPVTVTDSQLNINFSANADRPMVVAVEVYSFRASNVLSSIVPDPNVLAPDDKLTKPKSVSKPIKKKI